MKHHDTVVVEKAGNTTPMKYLLYSTNIFNPKNKHNSTQSTLMNQVSIRTELKTALY